MKSHQSERLSPAKAVITAFSIAALAAGTTLLAGCESFTPGPHRIQTKNPKLVYVLEDLPPNRELTANVLDEREFLSDVPLDCYHNADDLIGKKVTYGLKKDQPVSVYDVTNALQTEAPEANSKAIPTENEYGAPNYPSTIVNCLKQVGNCMRAHDYTRAITLYDALNLDKQFRDNIWVLRGRAYAYSKKKDNETAIKEQTAAINFALTKLNQPDGFTPQCIQRLYQERASMYRQIGNDNAAVEDERLSAALAKEMK